MNRRFFQILLGDGCWEWPGAKNDKGYGQFRLDGQVQYVHRIAYERWVGPIPEGLVIDHLCRNRACFNPRHLEVVTPGENTRRGAPARQTHCLRGHVYDEQNTYRDPNGRRRCRACRACDYGRAA